MSSLNQPEALKKAFIFELDNVIYPEKDYLLQVYYLFAQFIEYTVQKEAAEIIAFMQQYYHTHGDADIFKATAAAFDLPEAYADNFNLLYRTARLPLKLLLYKDILMYMEQAAQHQQLLFLLVSGDPEMQLNKIRQIEWNGLENRIKVYFLEELKLTQEEGLSMIQEKHSLQPEEIRFFRDKK